jgi:hypothetical protein
LRNQTWLDRTAAKCAPRQVQGERSGTLALHGHRDRLRSALLRASTAAAIAGGPSNRRLKNSHDQPAFDTSGHHDNNDDRDNSRHRRTSRARSTPRCDRVQTPGAFTLACDHDLARVATIAGHITRSSPNPLSPNAARRLRPPTTSRLLDCRVGVMRRRAGGHIAHQISRVRRVTEARQAVQPWPGYRLRG